MNVHPAGPLHAGITVPPETAGPRPADAAGLDELAASVWPRTAARGEGGALEVAGVDVRDLASISEARAELEGFAARLAAGRAMADERRTCQELVEELDSGRDETDARKLIYFDQRIHRHVYRCTHNEFLETTLEEYFVLTLRLWLVVIDRVERLDEAVQEHRELLEAIVDSDAQRAEDVMRRHIVGFEKAIRAVL